MCVTYKRTRRSVARMEAEAKRVLAYACVRGIHAEVTRRLPGVKVQFLSHPEPGRVAVSLVYKYWSSPLRANSNEVILETFECCHHRKFCVSLETRDSHASYPVVDEEDLKRKAAPIALRCLPWLRPLAMPYTPQEVHQLLAYPIPYLNDLTEELLSARHLADFSRFNGPGCAGHHSYVSILNLCAIAVHPCEACRENYRETSCAISLARIYHEENPLMRKVVGAYIDWYVRGIPPQEPRRPPHAAESGDSVPPPA